jgi:type IV secretion system protein VirD4
VQRTPPRGPNRRSSPAGGLVLGALLCGAAHYWPSLTGAQPDVADQLYLGFFKVMGGLSMLNALTGYYSAWRQREKRKSAEVPSGTFGAAAFATLEDCEAAGLLDPHGLYLGVLDGQPLFYSGKAHLLTCAPARQGKGICVVIVVLLHYQGSLLVNDPKGELAAATGPHRAEFLGHKVAYFNPWGLHGLPQDRINPLYIVIILAADPVRQRGLTDEVRAIVLQLVPEPEDARNRFFRDGTRTILFAVILYLALHAPERCALPEVWRIIANSKRLKRTFDAIRRSEALGGLLADLGDDLAEQMEDNPEQFGDFRAGGRPGARYLSAGRLPRGGSERL